MNVLDRYKIDLKHLRSGVESYRFDLSHSFFEAVEATLVTSGDVTVDLSVRETAGVFLFTFKIDGVVQVPCDRCLDNVDVAVHTESELKVKLGESFADDGEVVVLPEEDAELNVAWHIYEFIALEIPMSHVHADGQCNEKMMAALRQHLVSEADDETTEQSETTDPRWNELKKILDNN